MIGPGANHIASRKVWSLVLVLVLVGFMKFGQFLLLTDVRKAYMHYVPLQKQSVLCISSDNINAPVFLETVTVCGVLC